MSHHISYLIQVDDIPKAYHLSFLINLTRFLGFYPNDNWSEKNQLFDLDNAVFTQLENKHAHCLDSNTSSLLHLILQTQLNSLETLDISSEELKTLLRAILNFYALHSHGFTKLKSLSVFEDLNE